jgi:hypothetical protein
MNPLAHRLLPLVLALCLPVMALAESRNASGPQPSANASIRLRVEIPALLQLRDNRHPAAVPLSGTAVQQQLDVQTTLRHGFCATLRLTMSGVRDWTVQSVGSPARVQRTPDGYRVCAERQGRHQVALEHRFDFGPSQTTGSVGWPVQIELSAL